MKKIILILSILLPSMVFAQDVVYYYNYSNPYYTPYQCGTPGTICGSSHSYGQSVSHPYQYSQIASVAAVFTPAPAPVVNTTPQLPRTGGGGKAIASQTNKQTVSATPAKSPSFWSEIVADIGSMLASIF